jgi:hypothetical protein
MGCDIHLFAEAKKKSNLLETLIFWNKPKWVSIEKWVKDSDYEDCGRRLIPDSRFYSGGRNYNLFCALCGVRSYGFKHRPPRISNPKGLPVDVCKEIKSVSDDWDTDGHSHNWNTLKELKEFDWSIYGETVRDFLEEVIPKMEAQNVKDTDVRIVYFFDN